MRHVITVRAFEPDFLKLIFDATATLKKAHQNRLDSNHRAVWQHYATRLNLLTLASVFFQESTRTRFSTEAAMWKLGGTVIETESAAQFSSAVKGEDLGDMIRVLAGYCDIIALRHPVKGSAATAMKVSPVPIINAGDGQGEHPTQALLDLYTICERYPDRSNLTIAFVGDLKRGRTVHSATRLLAQINGTSVGKASKLLFVGPEELQIPSDEIAYAKEYGLEIEQHLALTEPIMRQCDVIYMTRVQNEHGDKSGITGSVYTLTPELAQHLPRNATIMHPLPRRKNEELPESIDKLPQAYYFQQAWNGLYVRMALLLWIFDKI